VLFAFKDRFTRTKLENTTRNKVLCGTTQHGNLTRGGIFHIDRAILIKNLTEIRIFKLPPISLHSARGWQALDETAREPVPLGGACALVFDCTLEDLRLQEHRKIDCG
jgi:hypothetical protein